MSCLVIAVEEMLMGSVVDVGMSRNDLDKGNAIKRQERLARAFREHMTEGQKFEETGQYGEEFFEEVIDRAKDVSIRSRLWHYVADEISQVYTCSERK